VDSRLKRAAQTVSQSGGVFMFLRAQLSAQVATVADFLLTILLVRLAGVYYLYATLAGAIFGGVVNCVVNYKWTFKSKVKKMHIAVKFIAVWIGSIWLNTWGTYALTEWMARSAWVQTTLSLYVADFFIIPKVVVAVAVALLWNYNMQRLFVYRNVDIRGLLRRDRAERMESTEE
jgi:putative flippase GtrA